MYIFVLSLCGIILLIAMIKTHHFFKSLIISSIQGLVAFFAVNFIGGFTGLHLAFNLFSFVISSFAGLPGVILLVISDMISGMS